MFEFMEIQNEYNVVIDIEVDDFVDILCVVFDGWFMNRCVCICIKNCFGMRLRNIFLI